MDIVDINRFLFFDLLFISKDIKVSDLKKKFEVVDIIEDKYGIIESDFLNLFYKVNQDFVNLNKIVKKRVNKKLEEVLNNNVLIIKSIFEIVLKVNEV